MAMSNGALEVSAAGEPAPVAAFAHIGPLGAVRQPLVELRAAQPIMAVAGQAFILDHRRLLRFGLDRLDEEPVFASAFRPLAGRRLPAVARGQEPGFDFTGGWQGSISRFHSYAVYCLYAVTVRRCAGISSLKFRVLGVLYSPLLPP